MQEYHDREWGIPVHDDRRFFEYLVLDAMQAGLSWRTILYRRETFRSAFAQFDPQAVAAFGEEDVKRLLLDPGIIRNNAKIRASIGNAREFLRVQREHGSFDEYIWQFVGGNSKVNNWDDATKIPTRTDESEAMSFALKARGFNFVGPTICYAFMQAAGLVNDHETVCFRHPARSEQGAPFASSTIA
jgi:DNA-3-methyladenine glycosylase I